MVRAHATGECDRCLEPASFDIAGEIEEVYLFEEPEDPEAYEDGYDSWVRTASSIWVSPSTTRSSWTRRLSFCASPIAPACAPIAAAISTSSNAHCAAQAEAEWAAATENPFAALKNLKLDE